MTNDREEREVSMLCLHLLQSSLVYINTLMIQEVLTAPGRNFPLGPGFKAPLTPLVHLHVNPYGIFRLDMSTRLKLAGVLSPRL